MTTVNDKPNIAHSGQIIAAANTAVPVLREFAGLTEETSRLPQESAAALVDAGSFARSSQVQRLWRNLETASRQPALGADITREIYGRALVGTPEQVSPLV